MSGLQTGLAKRLARAPVVPVLTVETVRSAVPLALALVEGGLPLIEITLRTGAGLDSIRAVAAEVEGAEVGAGTVLTPSQYRAAVGAGATFVVSPGTTAGLLEAASETGVPLLPGAVTASEVMQLLEHGLTCMKFFPAEAAGGVGYLRALSTPLKEARFCPTGGIDLDRAAAYLALSNVLSVGSSWVAPSDAIRSGDWRRITDLARAAAALRGQSQGRA